MTNVRIVSAWVNDSGAVDGDWTLTFDAMLGQDDRISASQEMFGVERMIRSDGSASACQCILKPDGSIYVQDDDARTGWSLHRFDSRTPMRRGAVFRYWVDDEYSFAVTDIREVQGEART